MPPKRGLGRGLGALIRDDSQPQRAEAADNGPGVCTVAVADIRRNRMQPRRLFEESALKELADSISRQGVLQPLLVRKLDEGYELVAGERRLRAAALAGLQKVPVQVIEAEDRLALELALVENLQREDLNVIEEAEGYRALSETFSMTQEDIAARIGKSRAAVANALRLLALPESVKQMLAQNRLSSGHAKVLLGLEIAAEQEMLAGRVLEEDLSVRSLEKIVRQRKAVPRKPRAVTSDLPASHLNELSDRLHKLFGTQVKLTPSRTYANGKKARGSIEIDFYSNDDLDRILDILGLSG